MIEILTASLLIMLASLSGVLFIWKGVGKIISRNLHYLVSLSAGVYLMVSSHLGQEVLHQTASMTTGILWILLGGASFWAIFKLLPGFHHHHDEEKEDKPHSKLDARRIITGDAIHNIADGVLLATSFSVSPTLGIITTVNVFVHEFVQETSEFFVLKQAGYSTTKALLVNLTVSSTILIGAVGSSLLLEVFAGLEIPLMGIAAGAFLVVVFQDLIPHSIRQARVEANHLKHSAWFIVGLILMLCVSVISTHGHGEADHSDHEENTHIHYEKHLNH